jgi:hypothetical protein
MSISVIGLTDSEVCCRVDNNILFNAAIAGADYFSAVGQALANLPRTESVVWLAFEDIEPLRAIFAAWHQFTATGNILQPVALTPKPFARRFKIGRRTNKRTASQLAERFIISHRMIFSS